MILLPSVVVAASINDGEEVSFVEVTEACAAELPAKSLTSAVMEKVTSLRK